VEPPSDPIAGTPFINDTKIRVQLIGVYFYQNTTNWGHDYGYGSSLTSDAIAAHSELEKWQC
jgi:hypothetical protein